MSNDVFVSLSDSNTDRVAIKLHKQFGHAGSSKLLDLVRKAGVTNEKLDKSIRDAVDFCDVCKRLKKPSPRPVVGFSLADDFNEAVSMDLKSWGSQYFFVIVDVATKFCTATVINNKCATTIVNNLFTSWIVLFGAPKKILSDNGAEFNNAIMRELGEVFNVRVLTTAAESPWSNGVCERQNAVLGDSVRKIVADCKCDVNVALAWAVAARNSLANYSGYAPNQLVFGRNPALPNVFIDRPPALTLTPCSEIVRNNLNAMHAARQDYVRLESSEKVKRALRHNIRSTEADDLHNGSQVYYKRNDSYQWYGPGVVIGRDGKQFLVRHGGVYVRVHACRLTSAPISGEQSTVRSAVNEPAPATSTNIRDEESEDEISVVDLSARRSGDGHPDNGHDIVDDQIGSSETTEDQTNIDTTVSRMPSNDSSRGRNSVSLKAGQRFKGILSDNGEVISGKIVSRAGKSTGRYKNCFNVERDTDGSIGYLDFGKELTDWEIVPDEEELLVLFNSEDVMVAKQKEIENWKRNEVFEEVENAGQSTISARWVVTNKVKNGQPIIKARLVARGFEEDTSDLRKDSPTCSKESVRLVLSFACSKQWSCHTIDVKSAYLQGNVISREVYLKPPPEYDNGSLWKLRKTIYGLGDAARQWYLRVKDELSRLGVAICSLDAGVFYWRNNGEISGVICLYVDDFLWAGTDVFKTSIVDKLGEMFQIGSRASKAFKYIGLNIDENEVGATLVDQFDYAQTLKPIEVSHQRSRSKLSELSEKEKAEYRALLGQLNWIATHTRPDIAFDVCELSVNYNTSTVADLLNLNKVVRRVTSDNIRLHFPKLQDISYCSLECYSDASFANLPGSGSQGGFIIFLQDGTGAHCPIVWQSRKIRRVVKSTLAAETLALVECVDSAVYIKEILSELSGCTEMPINCYVDNKSLFDSLNSNKHVDDKRLRIDLAVLNEMIERKEIQSVRWVDTTHQLADCLTKKGASAERLRAAISKD